LDAVIQVPLAACSVTLGPRSTGGISALVSAQGQRTYSEVTHLLRCLDEAGMLLSLGKGNPDLTLHSLSHFQPRQSFAIPGQRFPACATERWAFVAEACGLGQEACGTSPLFISANCIVTELVRLDRAGSLTREAAVHWNQWYLEHVRDASSSAALRMQAGGDGLIASVHHLWELAHARFRHEFQYRELLFKNPSNRRVHTRLLELAPTLVRQGQTHERMQLLIRQWIERIRDRPGVRIAAPQRLPSLEQEPHGSPRGTLDDRMRSYEVGLLLCDELAQDLFRLALAN
jgi:hypothetical protein